MSNFSGADVVILTVAVYVAIVYLVQLMQRRRDEVVARLQAQVAAEQRRKRASERQQSRQRERVQRVPASRPGRESDRSAA